jgi:hypothetical protein
MATDRQIHEKTASWLLESTEPGLRYLALRDLSNLHNGYPVLVQAAQLAHSSGPIRTYLDAMAPDGYWSEPGPGYLPKYYSTVWSLIALAQLGASADIDVRVERACRYICDHALTEYGQFSASGTPGSTCDCLQGNLLASLLGIGFWDARLDLAVDWMARSVTGEGIAPLGDKSTPLRFYAGKCGPNFACGSNNKQPCAWGAVKVMLAFSKLPESRHTPQVTQSIQQGIDFLLGVDPATADYPNGWAGKPSRNWWKFGFPVFYVTDVLQIAEALVGLGLGQDPRLANLLLLIREKADPDGRWMLEYDYNGKTWANFGLRKQPNQWVTLRALRVLKQAGTR